MNNKPTVVASHETERFQTKTLGGQIVRDSPGVEIRVEFTLHQHEVALKALDAAVQDVIDQIKETNS